jgi:hypothetical protein
MGISFGPFGFPINKKRRNKDDVFVGKPDFRG